MDIDDNPPFFQLLEYESAPILETVSIGTIVLEGKFINFNRRTYLLSPPPP